MRAGQVRLVSPPRLNSVGAAIVRQLAGPVSLVAAETGVAKQGGTERSLGSLDWDPCYRIGGLCRTTFDYYSEEYAGRTSSLTPGGLIASNFGTDRRLAYICVISPLSEPAGRTYLF